MFQFALHYEPVVTATSNRFPTATQSGWRLTEMLYSLQLTTGITNEVRGCIPLRHGRCAHSCQTQQAEPGIKQILSVLIRCFRCAPTPVTLRAAKLLWH